MNKTTLTTEQGNSLRVQIESVWGWSGYYFFPLHSTTRNDVLAFDGNLLEPIFSESEFQRFIESLKPSCIKCWREIGESEILQPKFFEFGYGYSEIVVVEEGFNWLIYWSHEGTITFGGEELITKLKILLPNWSSALHKLS